MENITPSDTQGCAIATIRQWFETGTDRQPVFRLFGFAGTGKSTVLKFALDDLGLAPHTENCPGVVTATFTGKAALVLWRKGTPARTIHSLIYSVIEATEEEIEEAHIETSHERVAVDRNRITGGGVTAGIDFGLIVIAELKGQDAAEFVQLALEYDPQPPFNAGHPRTARPEIVAMISGAKGIMGEMTPQGVEIAKAHRAVAA